MLPSSSRSFFLCSCGNVFREETADLFIDFIHLLYKNGDNNRWAIFCLIPLRMSSVGFALLDDRWWLDWWFQQQIISSQQHTLVYALVRLSSYNCISKLITLNAYILFKRRHSTPYRYQNYLSRSDHRYS